MAHIAFSDFGQQFLETLLTDQLIAAQVESAIPPIIYFDETTYVVLRTQGDVKSTHEISVSRKIWTDEIRFVVRVGMKMRLYVNGVDLKVFPFVINLRINFSVYEPLLLFADMPPIAASDVDVSNVSWDGGALEGGIARGVADSVSKQIQASASSRVIDLQALLLEKTAADRKAPDRGIVALDPKGGLVAPRDLVGEVELKPGRSAKIDVFLRKGERIRFILASYIEVAPPAIFQGVQLTADITPIKEKPGWCETASVTEGFGGIGYRFTVPSSTLEQDEFYTAEEEGRHRLTISNEIISACGALIQVRQERKYRALPVNPAKRMSFGKFGSEFIRLGLSAEFFRDQIGALLENPIEKGWAYEFLGSVRAVKVVAGLKISRIDADDAVGKPGWQAHRRIALQGTIDFMSAESSPAVPSKKTKAAERLLRIPIQIVTLARIETSGPPASILIGLAGVEKFDIKIDQISGIDHATEVLARKSVELLETQLLGVLRATVNGLLEHAVLQAVSIAELAAGLVAAARPATVPPKPVSAGFSAKGELQGGKTDVYGVQLEPAKQFVATAEFKPTKPAEYVAARASLAICDEHGAAYEVVSADYVPGTKKQILSLKFKTPRADLRNCQVRFRAHPLGKESWRSFKYEIKVTGSFRKKVPAKRTK